MSQAWATTIHLVLAGACIALGATVLVRNPFRRDHLAFAALALVLTLWAAGVAAIVRCETVDAARFWIRATFIVASFLPLCFHYFVGVVARKEYEGPRWLLISLLAAIPVLIGGAFSPWHVVYLAVSPGQLPHAEYGVVFHVYAAVVAVTMIFSYPMLFSRLKHATGLERRQLHHVILGITVFTSIVTITSIMLPLFRISTPQAYGPISLGGLLAVFAYAIVRYDLLDVKVVISRGIVYAAGTAFLTAIFLIARTVFGRLPHLEGPSAVLLSVVLVALAAAVFLEPLNERLRLLLEQTVLRRRYDIQQLLARASKNATRFVKLDDLLRTVCEDIRDTVRVTSIKVLLVDENKPNSLVLEYASPAVEEPASTCEYRELLDYLRDHPDPLVLKRLIHRGVKGTLALLAEHLAELDAHLCVPLQTKSGLVGIVTLGEKLSRDIFTSEDVMVFSTLASPLATAIDNARLYRKLEEANLHRERVLATMRGGVVAVDGAGCVTTLNEAAREIMGPVTLGAGMDSLSPPVRRVLEKTLRERRAIRDFETVIQCRDGERIPVAMSSAPLPSAEDTFPSGAMVMIYDLRQIKRLEQNVQRAHRLSSIGTLAAGMAHEIKNPLVSIKTFTQLLMRRYDDPDFRSTFIEVVPTEVERIDSIVSQLLDFARPKPADFGRHDVREVVHKVLSLVENQIRKENVRVTTEFVGEPLEIQGDNQQLHQVFLNLVLNALDAMRQTESGWLHIQVERGHMQRRPNDPDTVVERPCVKIAVRDNGCGIPPAELEGIFAPFYTTKESGTGLGLSVVHAIVTEHGGQVDVESTPGKGATFTVSLPSAESLSSVREN